MFEHFIQSRSQNVLICINVGSYKSALTRGKQYVVLNEDAEKAQVRIKGDNNRTRWFSMGYFAEPDFVVPVVESWKFDDDIQDCSEASLEHIEITITFSNGEKRWCSICTKAGLADYVDRNMDGSVLYLEHVIVVKNLTREVINEAIHELDGQDQLIGATKLL